MSASPHSDPTKPEDWKIDAAWKILELNVGFSRHFDFKPAAILAIAGGLSIPVGDRLKTIWLSSKPGAVWHTGMWAEFALLLICSICLFFTFLMILGAVS